MKYCIIILKEKCPDEKMPSVRIKDLEIEHVYYDDDPPQEWLEENPGRPITDEDIKDFFSECKKSDLESELSDNPDILNQIKKVMGW